MFGTILKLDCARQNRVDPKGFMSLFSAKAQKAIEQLDTKAPSLNSSLAGNPNEPTLTRNSLYPFYFDATMLRTLYYNIRIHGGLPPLARVFINQDNSVVFEFQDTINKEDVEKLQSVLTALGHTEFVNPEKSGKRVGFDIEVNSYTEPKPDANTTGDTDE